MKTDRKMNYWWERLNSESDAENILDFMKESNFYTEVSGLPVYAYFNNDYVQIPNHQVCVKNGKPLFVVKNRFKLLNNESCFMSADLLKSEYKSCKFVSCGDILNNKKSYVTLHIKDIEIYTDEFSVYVTLTNGFDGRNAVNCILTLMRKKDHAVLQIDDAIHKRIWTMSRIEPSKNYTSLVKNIEGYLVFIKSLCEKLNESNIDLNETIKPMFSLDWKKSKRINRHIAEEKEYIRDIYIQNNGKSLYDLYFAISSYYCNYRLKRNGKLGDDVRFDFAMCGYFYQLYDYGNFILKLLK